MPANLENSTVATGLEKVSFHSNPKERQCQRMLKLPHNRTHLFQNFPQFIVIHTVKGFGIVNKAEIDVFLEISAAATGLEKVTFHSNPKERQCQRMFKLPQNCSHLTC